MTAKPPSVLLVDDDLDTLESLAVLTTASPRLHLAGVAASGRDAVARNEELRPDVIVTDVRMPGVDGLSVARAILRGRRASAPRVLVMTAYRQDDYLLGALGAGADGFLPKGTPWPELEQAILRVHAGEVVVPPDLVARMVRLLLPGSIDLSELSPRELEVLTLVGEGLGSEEIATALCISEGTVRAHLEHLRRKLRAGTKLELGLVARSAGLVVQLRD